MPLPSNNHQQHNRGILSGFPHLHRHTDKQIDIISHSITAPMTDQPPKAYDVSQVGIHSIAAYLESHPEFKQEAVLITDHSYPELFFRVPGNLKRIAFKDAVPSQNTVMLFEFADPETLVDYIGEYPHSGINLFDSASYIFVRTTAENWHQCQQVFEYVDEFTEAKLHIGLPTQSTNDASIYAALHRASEFKDQIEDPTVLEAENCPAWQRAEYPINIQAHAALVLPGCTVYGNSAIDEIDISSLYSLRLEGISSLKDRTFPELRELTIITRPHHDGSPAVISGIVAPELRRLVIHYAGGLLPVITDMNVATTVSPPVSGRSRFYGASDDNMASVELLNIELADSPRTSASQVEKKQTIHIDPDFFGRFHNVHLYGTPLGLLQHCEFSYTYSLRWKICQRPTISPRLCRMPSLRHISIEVSAPNMSIPGISTEFASSIYINVTAPLVSIERACHIHSVVLEYLHIYNSPHLIKSGEVPLIAIDHDHIEGLKICLHSGKIMSLTGIFLPFLTRDPNGYSSETLSLNSCDKVILRPVLSREKFHPLSGYQGYIFARTGILLLEKLGFVDDPSTAIPDVMRELRVLPLILPSSSSSSDNTDAPSAQSRLILPVLLSSGGDYKNKITDCQVRQVSVMVDGTFSQVFASGKIVELDELRTTASGPCFKLDIYNKKTLGEFDWESCRYI